MVRPYKMLLAAVCLVALAGTAVEGAAIALLFPLIASLGQGEALANFPVQAFTDYFGNLSPKELVVTIGVALPLIWGLRSFLLYGNQLLCTYLGLRVQGDWQERAYSKVSLMDFGSFVQNSRGDIYAMLAFNPVRAGTMAQQAALHVMPAFLLLLYLGGLLFLSWQLTLVSMFLALIQAPILVPLNRISTRANIRLRGAMASFSSEMYETIDGQKEIRLYGQERRFVQRVAKAVHGYVSAAFRTEAVNGLATPVLSTVSMVLVGGLMIASAFLFVGLGEGWMQTLLLFLVFAIRLNGVFSQLSRVPTVVGGNLPVVQQLLQFVNATESVAMKPGYREVREVQRGIELRGVSFSYAPGEASVLKDVSFFVPRHRVTAIVGPSGGGKSTLIHLLLRLYDPTEGCVLVDDLDLKEADLKSWRERIGVISQDVFLFNTTMANNIAFGNPEAPLRDVALAARSAEIEGLILSLPNGYETTRGDRAVKLSGGQRQRIALARALLVRPEILIMDEATSNLDSETETAILASLEWLRKDKTVIIIAHRLSTVRHADKIVVMDQGRVVEEGTHEELMVRRGRYFALVQAQTSEEERLPAPAKGGN